ncbi:MAG: hypothetical protein ACT4P7_20230 [Gemmatimonadaceae bacterium]
MRHTSLAAGRSVSHIVYMMPFVYAIALASLLLLLAPRTAAAQRDAIRVMAGRVLDGMANGGSRGDRDGSIWRDDDIYQRDRDGAWERERRAREKWCRKHRNDRRCDGQWQLNRRNGANWCWDRDRNGRCDVNRQAARGRARADRRWALGDRW